MGGWLIEVANQSAAFALDTQLTNQRGRMDAENIWLKLRKFELEGLRLLLQ